MKRRICILLVAAMLLLGGCGEKMPALETTVPETMESIVPVVTPLEPVGKPGNGLIDYDSDRQIYFTLGNYDMDIYMMDSGLISLRFYILSKQPLDISTLKINIPVANPYTAEGFAVDPQTYRNTAVSYKGDDPMVEESQHLFPYYLYLCYQDHPWSLEEDRTKTKDYGMLTPQELPEYYIYKVNLNFSTEGPDESFREMDITIDGVIYHQQVGEVRLHPEHPMQYPIDWTVPELIDFYNGGVTPYYGWDVYPYNDGLCYQPHLITMVPPWDMTLLSLETQSQIELVEAKVKIDGMDFYWDGTEPIDVKAGQSVIIDAVLRDPNMDKLNYLGVTNAVLYYAYPGGRAARFAECGIRMTCNFNDIYAMVFDGVDMESYYRNHYYPNYETWRTDYD